MHKLPELFANNRRWAADVEARHPGFFGELAAQQAPRYLWIGCSDSRVPANEIVGLAPGELFVHRNVANLVLHNDFSCLSVLQYAIEVLEVEHVMVVGHYGCGGVTAAWQQRVLGLVDNWLQPIRDVAYLYRDSIMRLPSEEQRIDRLCELNVLFQARRVCRTTIVQQAWERGHRLTVHAWVYRLTDGLLRDLGFCATDRETAESDFARVAGLGTIGAEPGR
ncbi:MAG TPA: carbonate dehydratase [Steroidobacteraceae bacterium]|nr:carbonate dehydratase [Steroidobacteraceae bacterium]